ncbi:alpha-mannosidase [Mediterraneibacter glycyrrhizinilyticus]|uniref:alpha-mannosidase n=1 Tax=Mediterraneibacter glycyrrhizinilyticus TaxID=342942 RepID=UPI0025AAD2F2|nr:alpha-mannosidase [Mediterraneibacter glycyrrhizinilyticus]MDN0044706.1 alpha-mannosidase [Mediterraneibacter glycyrrhizinilyticus]
MFLTEKKLGRRIEELKNYRYRDIRDLEEFLVKEDEQGVVNPILPQSFDGWDTLRTGEYWSGRDAYLWMHRDIPIPDEWNGRKIVFLIDCGRSKGPCVHRFELMFYLNGTMYQGVDENHKEVFLSDSLCGTTADVTLRMWSGLEDGGAPEIQEHRLEYARLAWLDEKTDDLYYLSSMVLKTVECLGDKDPVTYELRTALDQAFRRIDWSYPGSEEFYRSVYEADAFLNDRIDSMEKHSPVEIWCTGHSHIDLAWLWRIRHTKEKASRTFSTVLRMMEMYPEYIFLQSQPQLYEWVKENFPDIYAGIKERAAEGRWETDGAMWVEADCNLTSGESLTRQILLGSRFLKEEFGHEPEFLWLPDVFGYSWAIPQILKKAGIKTFMTTKISWSQYNRMPHDTFWWKGIDGSEVLTHFITVPDPWNDDSVWQYTYSGQVLPNTVKGTWTAYKDKEINKDLLMAYGFGDGGGGVNRDMLENMRRISRIPGLPSVRTAKAGDYFRKLHETVENTDGYVHTWDGELYLEYHRGTYTSQAYNKKMNRRMEMLYRRAEWLTVMDALMKASLDAAQQEKLTKGWKHLLTNQFHDIIPGSSIHEVYEDSRKDYEYIEQTAREVEQDFYDHVLSDVKDTYTVFNDSSWTMTELVSVPEERDGIFIDDEGNVLKTQKSDRMTYVEVRDIPATGYRTIRFEEEMQEEQGIPFSIEGRTVETPYYVISLNQAGQIIRLYDRTYEREVLPEGERANVLQVFEDKPLDFDAWDIDIFYRDKMREITDLTVFEVTECGPLRMTVRMEWKYMNSTVSQEMILYSDNRRIDFHTKADWHERQQLLKASFPVDIRSTYGTYDVQYGNVRRPNNWNTSWEQARFESVAHRWADLSERNYGVSILNDCKYGHDIRGNVMRITLIKSAVRPDYLQDQGTHEFTYALLPHGGDFVEGRVVQEAFTLNEPVHAVIGEAKLPYRSFLTLDNDQVELDAVKKSEDGRYIVVRFHEFAGSRQKVTVRPGFDIVSWTESDLRERPVGEKHADKKITLELGAYEIKTVLIEV